MSYAGIQKSGRKMHYIKQKYDNKNSIRYIILDFFRKLSYKSNPTGLIKIHIIVKLSVKAEN